MSYQDPFAKVGPHECPKSANLDQSEGVVVDSAEIYYPSGPCYVSHLGSSNAAIGPPVNERAAAFVLTMVCLDAVRGQTSGVRLIVVLRRLWSCEVRRNGWCPERSNFFGLVELDDMTLVVNSGVAFPPCVIRGRGG